MSFLQCRPIIKLPNSQIKSDYLYSKFESTKCPSTQKGSVNQYVKVGKALRSLLNRNGKILDISTKDLFNNWKTLQSRKRLSTIPYNTYLEIKDELSGFKELVKDEFNMESWTELELNTISNHDVAMPEIRFDVKGDIYKDFLFPSNKLNPIKSQDIKALLNPGYISVTHETREVLLFVEGVRLEDAYCAGSDEEMLVEFMKSRDFPLQYSSFSSLLMDHDYNAVADLAKSYYNILNIAPTKLSVEQLVAVIKCTPLGEVTISNLENHRRKLLKISDVCNALSRCDEGFRDQLVELAYLTCTDDSYTRNYFIYQESLFYTRQGEERTELSLKEVLSNYAVTNICTDSVTRMLKFELVCLVCAKLIFKNISKLDQYQGMNSNVTIPITSDDLRVLLPRVEIAKLWGNVLTSGILQHTEDNDTWTNPKTRSNKVAKLLESVGLSWIPTQR